MSLGVWRVSICRRNSASRHRPRWTGEKSLGGGCRALRSELGSGNFFDLWRNAPTQARRDRTQW